MYARRLSSDVCDLFVRRFYEEGTLWSWNFFLYNKKLKRIVFFRASSFSTSSPSSDSEGGDASDDGMDFSDEEYAAGGAGQFDYMA